MKTALKYSKLVSAIALATLSGTAWAQTTLNVAAFANYDQAIRMAIPMFEKENPDIKINLTSLAFDDHHTAMTTSLSTGANVPDVMAIEVGYIGRFANAGGLEDLNQPPYNAGTFADTFSPFTVPLGQNNKGEQSSLPVDIGPGAIFYHSEVLAKAGVTQEELLRDWDSFIESGKKIKEKTGSYLVADAVDIKDIVIRSGLKDGESIYFDQDNKIMVESDRFKEAFKLAKQVRDAHLDAQVKAWSTEWTEGLRRGDIASQMMGSWLGGHFNGWISPGENVWRTADLPANTFASWGGSFLAIPKRADHKDEAWKFIEFMSQRVDIQMEVFEQLNIFPSLIEAQNSEFMEQPVEYLGGTQARMQWKLAAANIPAIKAHRHDPIAEQIVDDALQSVLTRNVEIDKALSDAARQIERRARR